MVQSINEPGMPAFDEVSGAVKPTITSVEPASCVIGDPDFTLVVSGEGFASHSVIFFAGHDEPTTLEADGTITTGVKPSLWGAPAVVQVFVRNGALYGGPVDFEFTAPVSSRKVKAADEEEDEEKEEHHTRKRHR